MSLVMQQRISADTHISKGENYYYEKQTKLLAVLSTAALAAALSFPAYAKNAGWAQENGNWYYYDSYGEPLTDTWKKSGDDWYYLDSDGIVPLPLRLTNTM